MKLQRFGLLAALTVLGGGPAAASDWFDWSDTQLRYWYGPNFREPGINGDIPKNIVSFTHADGYAWGKNFLNLDVLKSNSSDPASGSHDGAIEAYAVYRHDLSLNKVTNSTAFAIGPIRDLALVAGADLNTKNTTFDSEKRMPTAGLALSFDVPGFWEVAALWDKEFSHNGVVGKDLVFDSTWRFETAWERPFQLMTQAFSFEGFALINGPKGKDGFGAKTDVETMVHPKLMTDIGDDFGLPNHLKVGIGYEFWRNKFGESHALVPGSEANAYFAEVDYHF